MELTYIKCRDYLIPDLVFSDTREYHIGKYGRMRWRLSEEVSTGPLQHPAALRKTLFPLGGG